jgi:hypothetical protein
MEARPPRDILLYKLAGGSFACLLLGHLVFRRLRQGFYQHL